MLIIKTIFLFLLQTQMLLLQHTIRFLMCSWFLDDSNNFSCILNDASAHACITYYIYMYVYTYVRVGGATDTLCAAPHCLICSVLLS